MQLLRKPSSKCHGLAESLCFGVSPVTIGSEVSRSHRESFSPAGDEVDAQSDHARASARHAARGHLVIGNFSRTGPLKCAADRSSDLRIVGVLRLRSHELWFSVTSRRDRAALDHQSCVCRTLVWPITTCDPPQWPDLPCPSYRWSLSPFAASACRHTSPPTKPNYRSQSSATPARASPRCAAPTQ